MVQKIRPSTRQSFYVFSVKLLDNMSIAGGTILGPPHPYQVTAIHSKVGYLKTKSASTRSLNESQWPDFNTLRPRQNCHHFADDIFKYIFLNKNVWISLQISLKFVSKIRINNIPALVQIMAWRRTGDKPLYGPLMVTLLTPICVNELRQGIENSCPSNGHQVTILITIILTENLTRFTTPSPHSMFTRNQPLICNNDKKHALYTTTQDPV